MTDHIQTELKDRVLTIRLTRADKKNALTQAMYSAMAQAVREGGKNNEVRVLLFAGHPDCFCAGNDLADFMKTPPKGMDSPVIHFMTALAECEKPVIMAVSGVAVGIGVTMIQHAELVYCAQGTKFSMPFVNLGICPEFAASLLMPRFMGHVRAAELMLLGKPFTAEKAREYGLVNEVLPVEQLEATARDAALHIASLPPNAVRVTKRIMKHWTQERVKEAIPFEAGYFGPMLTQPEALEALQAFVTKRKPDFSRFN